MADKFRILWIDDCEGEDMAYGAPEPALPDALSQWFDIIRLPHRAAPSTVDDPSEFADLFESFWFEHARDVFPADVVAMDYVLDKRSSKALSKPKSSAELQASLDEAERTTQPESQHRQMRGVLSRATFEGLAIGVFYASMTWDHPTGIVPMTQYPDQMRGVPEVDALHQMSEAVLNIDYTKFGVAGEARKWHAVLRQGVKAFRQRLLDLVERRIVHPSLQDLLQILRKDADSLAITTRFGRRCYPLRGMFVDKEDDRWREDAIVFANQLMRNIRGVSDANQEGMITADELREAESLADWLWDGYRNEERVAKRLELASLLTMRTNGGSIEENRLRQLVSEFLLDHPDPNSITKVPAELTDCCDIRKGPHTPMVRRIAALMAIIRLLAFKDSARRKLEAQNGQRVRQAGPFFSELTQDDVLLVLFPQAATPLDLQDLADSLVAVPRRWRQEQANGGKLDISLDIRDVLLGRGRHDGKGMWDYERELLQWYARDIGYLTEHWDDQAKRLFRSHHV